MNTEHIDEMIFELRGLSHQDTQTDVDYQPRLTRGKIVGFNLGAWFGRGMDQEHNLCGTVTCLAGLSHAIARPGAKVPGVTDNREWGSRFAEDLDITIDEASWLSGYDDDAVPSDVIDLVTVGDAIETLEHVKKCGFISVNAWDPVVKRIRESKYK